MLIRLHAFDLPLAHPFRTSRGSSTSQATLVVELSQDGVAGYGEATSNRYFGATIDGMARDLAALRPRLAQRRLDDPERLWDEVHDALAHDRFALCALDEAAHDLWGKLRGEPVWKLWGLATAAAPASSYTIGIADLDTMIAKMDAFAGWPIFKIKLGTDRDLEIARELRRRTDATLRVDANCGWTADDAIAYARELACLGVELIEQPLPADRWDDMRRLRRESPLPIVADESCVGVDDVARCAGVFHGVNIKLTKCGGLTPARRMIADARRHGLSVMIGCMTESTVGISAAAQLLPLVDYADVDGAVLLADDVAEGVRLDRGRCIYPDAPGTGVRLIRSGREP